MDFILHEALLSFQELKGSHDGLNMGNAIYEVLDAYNIVEKLFCITTDNATNNKSALENLQKLMLDRKGIHWDFLSHHIRCMNHIINLAVQKFLKTCKILSDVEPVVDEDLHIIDDEDDEFTEEEQEERDAAAVITNNPEYQQEVNAAAEGFQNTMLKLHETAKVRVVIHKSNSTWISNVRFVRHYFKS